MSACCTPESVGSRLNVSTHQGCMNASVLMVLITTLLPRPAMVGLKLLFLLLTDGAVD